MKKIMILSLLVLGLCLAKEAKASNAPFNLWSVPAASATIVTTGPGSLFNTVISSGAAGEYVVCWDSANVTGLTGTAGVGVELSRLFIDVSTKTTGLPVPAGPNVIPFVNGLVCLQSAKERTLIYYQAP